MILYDQVNKCCYDSRYNKNIPEGCIEVSNELHQDIISALNTEGKDVEVVDGIPAVIDIEVIVDPSIAVWRTFEKEASANVTTTEPEGTWYGGKDSASSILGEAVLAEEEGREYGYITDTSRVVHKLTPVEIRKVSYAILNQWRDAFFKRQEALRGLGV